MSAASASIRTADLREPGANLYNLYLFLTQMTGIYSQAAGYDHHVQGKGAWRELSEQILQDLGDVYHIWDERLRSQAGKGLSQEEEKLGMVIVRTCKRLDRCNQLLDVWTPMRKWAALMFICERRWQRLLTRLVELDTTLAPALDPVQERGLQRQSRLIGLSEMYQKEAAKMRVSFAISKSIAS